MAEPAVMNGGHLYQHEVGKKRRAVDALMSHDVKPTEDVVEEIIEMIDKNKRTNELPKKSDKKIWEFHQSLPFLIENQILTSLHVSSSVWSKLSSLAKIGVEHQ